MKLIIPSDSSHGRPRPPSHPSDIWSPYRILTHLLIGCAVESARFFHGLPNLSQKMTEYSVKAWSARCRRNSALFGGGLECIIYSASEGVTAGGEVFVARTDYFSCFGRLDFLLRTVQLHLLEKRPGLQSNELLPTRVSGNINLHRNDFDTSSVPTNWLSTFINKPCLKEIGEGPNRQLVSFAKCPEDALGKSVSEGLVKSQAEMLLALVSSFRADPLTTSPAYTCSNHPQGIAHIETHEIAFFFKCLQ